MKSTPSLLTHNRFSVLSVDSITEIDELKQKDVQTSEREPSPENLRLPTRVFRPHWERCLPVSLVIDMLEEKRSARSLKLKVELEATDTGEVKSVSALLDSGATGMFIDRDYVKNNRLST